MVLFLAFGLVLFPINNMNLGEQRDTAAKYAPAIGESLFQYELQCERGWEPRDELKGIEPFTN